MSAYQMRVTGRLLRAINRRGDRQLCVDGIDSFERDFPNGLAVTQKSLDLVGLNGAWDLVDAVLSTLSDRMFDAYCVRLAAIGFPREVSVKELRQTLNAMPDDLRRILWVRK